MYLRFVAVMILMLNSFPAAAEEWVINTLTSLVFIALEMNGA
jgi:hypothetical protein